MGYEPDARAHVPDLLDRVVVARAVEHDHDDVADRRALLLRDQLERLRERPVEVEQVRYLLGAGHLLHVEDGARVEHRAAVGEGDDGERVGKALGAQVRALERVNRDVHLRR
jgi:hypothetical protein